VREFGANLTHDEPEQGSTLEGCTLEVLIGVRREGQLGASAGGQVAIAQNKGPHGQAFDACTVLEHCETWLQWLSA